MHVAIIGAGAIGAYVGAALARGGAEVTVYARGPHLEAMQARGIHVQSPRGDFHAHPRAVGTIAEIGPVDVAVLAVKAHHLPDVVGALPHIVHDATTVVTMQNGIPWWYFQRHGGPYDGTILQSVDPGGVLTAAIAPSRIVGSVIYCSTEIVEPGIIRHSEGTRYSLGELDRTITPRLEAISQAFVAGGLKAPMEADVRREVWVKILGNASFNPISALTRATLVDMADDPGVCAIVAEMMAESIAIAEQLGIEIGISIEKRIDGARRVGAHKTSMLQDLELGRPLEIEALVGAVVELGALIGVPTPATQHVYALTKLLEKHAPAANPRPREG